MRRKTSRFRNRRNDRQIQLQVRSSRIVGFEILRGFKRFAKFAVVLALLGAAIWGGREGFDHFFIENPEFQLREIDLQTNGCLTAQSFAEITGLDPEASIFAVSLREMSKKLRERPGIVSVKMSRRLPGTLKVEVEERIPVAWIECRRLGIIGRDPLTGVMVDSDGNCFPCEKWWEKSAADLPMVTVLKAHERDFAIGRELRHREAERGLALLQRSQRYLGGSSLSIPVVVVKNGYSLVAIMSDGSEVTFGMYDHDRQLEDFLLILDRARETDRSIVTVNLIPERNLPAMVRDGVEPATKELSPRQLEEMVRQILNRG